LGVDRGHHAQSWNHEYRNSHHKHQFFHNISS
jgi:hypothetical protein